MADDLISRSALLKKECCGRISGDDVRRAPTVDAVPVVHGRWIPNIRENTRAYPPYEWQDGFKCSLCGRVERKKEPYCNCGAKMVAGDDTNAQHD